VEKDENRYIGEESWAGLEREIEGDTEEQMGTVREKVRDLEMVAKGERWKGKR